MATVKFFLDRRFAKDLSKPAPLRIIIRHKNTSSCMSTDIMLFDEQWDGSHVQRHPQAKRLNIIIDKRLADIQSAIISLSQTDIIACKNAAELKGRIEDFLCPTRQSKETGQTSPGHPFVPYYMEYAESKKTKGTKSVYERALKWIRKYDLEIDGKCIEQLDKQWLTGLDEAMSTTCKKNTRSILLRSVRAVFTKAKNDGLITEDPFIGFDLREEPTAKRSMDVETLRKIRDCKVAPWQEEYRDMFMLMFYLIGINAADLFLAKKDQLVGDRLIYKRKKTGKQYSIKVHPEAMAILKKYEGKDWLLCPMDRYDNYKNYLQHMNRALSTLGTVYTTSSEKKGEVIFKDLSTYWARHTWATIAYELDIPIDTIGQALGHSDRQHTITFVYIKLDNKKVDEANRAVLDYLAA